VTASATVTGLVAYFLGVDAHRNNILNIQTQLRANSPTFIPPGLAWNLAVKQWLASLSYPRCTADNAVMVPPPNVVYNGEIPWDQNHNAVGKRQTAPSCHVNLVDSTFYLITPNYTADISVMNAFTNTLKEETNATTLVTSTSASGNFTTIWGQFLNQSQVTTYLSNPAVSVSCSSSGFSGSDMISFIGSRHKRCNRCE
jgi:hypothetical protein